MFVRGNVAQHYYICSLPIYGSKYYYSHIITLFPIPLAIPLSSKSFTFSIILHFTQHQFRIGIVAKLVTAEDSSVVVVIPSWKAKVSGNN